MAEATRRRSRGASMADVARATSTSLADALKSWQEQCATYGNEQGFAVR